MPQKIWARSVQPFWRLLDTNKQIDKPNLYIDLLKHWTRMLKGYNNFEIQQHEVRILNTKIFSQDCFHFFKVILNKHYKKIRFWRGPCTTTSHRLRPVITDIIENNIRLLGICGAIVLYFPAKWVTLIYASFLTFIRLFILS